MKNSQKKKPPHVDVSILKFRGQERKRRMEYVQTKKGIHKEPPGKARRRKK